VSAAHPRLSPRLKLCAPPAAARARLRALRGCSGGASCSECRRVFSFRQKPAERLETAKALMALLDPASDTYGGEAAVDAFLVCGGPSIMKYRLDSMDGLCSVLGVVPRARALARCRASCC